MTPQEKVNAYVADARRQTINAFNNLLTSKIATMREHGVPEEEIEATEEFARREFDRHLPSLLEQVRDWVRENIVVTVH